MAIIINTVNSTKFTYNGIEYYKNFTPIARGDGIEVSNTYDRKISLTDNVPVIYSDYTVDGSTFATVELLQTALLPVLFTRASLGSASLNLGDLNDVSLAGLTDDQVIAYELSTQLWKNRDETGGGGSGSMRIPVFDSYDAEGIFVE